MEQPGLEVIIHKPPIVATHVGRFDHKDSYNTIVRYEKEAQTYIRPPQIQEYQHKLVKAILDRQTSIGCLVAPFGYGKTSTAIDIWKACDSYGILAIAPFSCNSVAEMGLAIASGVTIGLAQVSTEAEAKIWAAYDAYLVSSAQRLAQQDSNQYDIEFDTALKSIQDKIERGYLHLEVSGINLLAFLERLVEIAIEAGFKGMLVIVDEFQQFLGTINKAIITNFRTLVWGLKTRHALPLGLLMTMDPDTERNLSERAGDILHRIKEDGLYLNFSSMYDREFPRLLWERYAEIFGFQASSRQIVDRSTLEAIGQICERADLSNGPRTVINAFQEIADTHSSRKRPYTPLDLIDDFLTGDIKFDGDRNKIASLVTELTGYDYIKQVPARVDTLKLIAAFPRGCPREVAAYHGLASTFDQLADELRGEILTQLPEGVALIDLQRVGKPQDKLNIILKKYWMQITEEEIIADRILLLFGHYAIEPLFPPFGNVLTGWRKIQNDFTLAPSGSYWQIYEGTFFDEYPLRRICIQLCKDINQIVDPIGLDSDEVHINLVFVLQQSKQSVSSSEYHEKQRTFIFYIPTNKPFDKPLTRDIRWIEDYLSPVVMTPGVLLSLVDYIERQVPTIEGLTETERLRIDDIQRKLQDFLVVMLFDGVLFTNLDIPVISRGAQAFREALFTVLRSLYPTYRTLITLSQWENNLKTYATALDALPLLQRRGFEPLVDTKSAIALYFGNKNHAGFVSQAKQFNYLLDIEEWSGNQGKIRFCQHPGETYLFKAIVSNHSLDEAKIFQEGHKAGYTKSEISYLLQFLVQRGYIQKDPERNFYHQTNTLSSEELKNLAAEILDEIDLIQSVTPEAHLTATREEVSDLITRLQADDIDYDEIQVRLLHKQHQLQESREPLRQRLFANLHTVHDQLYRLIERLKQALPLCETDLILDTHINGVQRTLTSNHEAVLKRLSKVVSQLGEVLKRPPSTNEIDLSQLKKIINTYHELSTQVQNKIEEAMVCVNQADLHCNWVDLVERIRRGIDYMNVAAQITNVTHLKRKLDDTIDRIKRDLATIGLREYDKIYNQYLPTIEKLLAEIDAAVRLAELTRGDNQNNSPVAPPEFSNQNIIDTTISDQIKLNGKGNLLRVLQHQKCLSMSELLSQGQVPRETLLQHLIDLEESGAITITIKIVANETKQ